MKKSVIMYSRNFVLMLIDFAIVFCSCLISFVLLKYLGMSWERYSLLINFSLSMGALTVFSMYLFGLYKNIWRYAGIRDLATCSMSIIFIWAICIIFCIYTDFFTSISQFFVFCSFFTSYFLIIMSRIVYRDLYYYINHNNKKTHCSVLNTLVVGAGYAGHIIIREMLQSDSDDTPVAIVDDDKTKIGRNVHGVKVVGSTNQIPEIVEKYDVKKIFIAIPSCSGSERKRILDICAKTSCDVKLLPYVYKMINGENYLGQAKEINIEDLLGRDPIKFDGEKNKRLINGKVCMVTGGGGSIGSELCRQIVYNNPKKLIIVDIYENNAYEIQQELLRNYENNPDLVVRVASVRDYDKMDALFNEFRPDIVFHAAAHKHVPLMEDSPSEAVKNNVFGTYNCAVLADKYDVEKFVLVSTDKAVNPTNVMGATKRCCEMIIEYMTQIKKNNTEFVAVRFGNVLGSNGSVVPLFQEQIKNGGPVTVTHPDIIRFFMTIPEATSLILQAASNANGGEIFVLDMGEPVKILNLAENVIKLSGKKPYEEIKITFTGLRPGEKLYEELLMSEEGLAKTENEKIFIGKQIEVDADEFKCNIDKLKRATEKNDDVGCVELLKSVVTTFNHQQ